MTADRLKPGDTFKRGGQVNSQTIKSIKDLDKPQPATKLMRGKLEITTTDGHSFWIYKKDTVLLVEQDPSDIDVTFEIV